MFKNKKSKEELMAEREEKIKNTSHNLNIIIKKMETKENSLLGKIIDARIKGLNKQETDARLLLKKCLATKKQVQGMLMTLELAIESRDLATTSQKFMESIGDLSKEIKVSNKKTNFKRTKRQYTRALYASKLQTDKIDDFLSLGDYDSVLAMEGNRGSEFDEQIDAMLEEAEHSYSNQNIKNKKQ